MEYKRQFIYDYFYFFLNEHLKASSSVLGKNINSGILYVLGLHQRCEKVFRKDFMILGSSYNLIAGRLFAFVN